jgi:chaperone modulatory protein CbpM
MATENDALWLTTQRSLTIVELAETCGLPEEVLRDLIEYGALLPADPRASEWVFSAHCVASVRTAARLGKDLELDTPVLALVLSFLERIEGLESELRHLNAQLQRPR